MMQTADRDEAAAGVTGHDLVECQQSTARDRGGRLVYTGVRGCVAMIEQTMTQRRLRADEIDVAASMKQLEAISTGSLGRDNAQRTETRRLFEFRHKGCVPVWTERMTARKAVSGDFRPRDQQRRVSHGFWF
jgi:hypothetical protein